jgi:hypothetical protein
MVKVAEKSQWRQVFWNGWSITSNDVSNKQSQLIVGQNIGLKHQSITSWKPHALLLKLEIRHDVYSLKNIKIRIYMTLFEKKIILEQRKDKFHYS